MLKQKWNHDWLFQIGGWEWWNRSEHYEPITLPHDFSISRERTQDSRMNMSGGYFPGGEGFYKKIFSIGEADRNKAVYIEFEGAYMNTEVKINGNFVGFHPYGYTSFVLDLTPYIRYDSENCIEVHVNNNALPNSRWYSGSGIYRNVWLMTAEPVHFKHWGVFASATNIRLNTAQLHIESTIVNSSSVNKQNLTMRHVIIDPNGNESAAITGNSSVERGGETVIDSVATIRNPFLWSVETPVLYTIKSYLYSENGQLLDQDETAFGIRDIQVSAERGLLLNGEPIKLRGGCVHHDNGILGAASYPRSEERKIELMKQCGYNAVRCAHNPPAPSFLDACDRLGMLVIDEAFDCWRAGKNPYDYHLYFDKYWKEDLSAMVLRDRNHPSVIMYSIGNEINERDGNSEGYAYANLLAQFVKGLDPTRFTTTAVNGVGTGWDRTDSFFAEVDVAGYNYLYKIYEEDHEKHKDRIICGNESFPNEVYENWEVIQKNDYIIGDFVWTSVDYLGEAGIGRTYYTGDPEDDAGFCGRYPWHVAYCGDIDICGFRRPQSYYREAVWGISEQPYIAVHVPVPEGKERRMTPWGFNNVASHWDFHGVTEPLTVDVYSCCDTVELIINGKSLGTQPVEKCIASFSVPFIAGECRAVAFRDGNKCGEYAIHTPGTAVKLSLEADRCEINGDEGLCYLTVTALDQEGHPVTNYNGEVSIFVSGAGECIAIGNNNPKSTEGYTGSHHLAHEGRLMAVVKATETGKIHITACANGLESASDVIYGK